MSMLAPFLIGFAMVFCVSLNTRFLAKDKPTLAHVAGTSLAIQLLWASGVRSVSQDPLAVPFYAVGATLGCVAAAGLRIRR